MGGPIAYLRRLDDEDSWHPCAEGDPGAVAVHPESEVERLREFLESIGDASGPYPDLYGHRIVGDSRQVLRGNPAMPEKAAREGDGKGMEKTA